MALANRKVNPLAAGIGTGIRGIAMSRSGISLRARYPLPARWLACLAAALLLPASLRAADPRSSLLMVEGQVTAVTEAPGEGNLASVAVQLGASAGGRRTWNLLLAPPRALAEIGFEVAVGDHLKARIFPSNEGPARVHKVLNLTRRKMVRMRTLSQIPLWDGGGAWQGASCRSLEAPIREDRTEPREPSR